MKTATADSTAPVGVPVPVPVPLPEAEPPVRLTLVVGSNREGRFGPVVADWLLSRIRERDDFVPEVVDVASVHLPTTFSPSSRRPPNWPG